MNDTNRRHLSITTDSSGHPKIEAFGYPDGSCIQAVAKLREALGWEDPLETEDKPEALLEEETQEVLQR